MPEEASQIAEGRREVKGKEVKEKYTKLKTESQRIEGEIRKPSYMNKEIEENNRTGKIRDLFRNLEISREHFMQGWA